MGCVAVAEDARVLKAEDTRALVPGGMGEDLTRVHEEEDERVRAMGSNLTRVTREEDLKRA